ncbi:hypothetical protein H0H92_005772 [Tricholoma furcatifolium]|nr:hypothetical protein H0H92_005772 [Tricholoma furcatifolium]
MITVRRDRILYISLGIILVTIFFWKTDFIGLATSSKYEPLHRLLDTKHGDATVISNRPSLASPHEIPAADSDTESSSYNNADANDGRTVIGPFTIIPEGAHSPGFTLLNNLYLRNGTLYVITPDVSKFPPREEMISIPRAFSEGIDLTPTDKEMQLLSPDDVEGTLGKYATRVEGLSVMLYDPPEFMSFSIKGQFRDRAGVDGPLMRAAWPSTPIEESDYWDDLMALEATVVFERVMLINRAAAHRQYVDLSSAVTLCAYCLTSPWSGQWAKMIGGTMKVPAPENFWTSIRDPLVTNLLGYLPRPVGEITTAHSVEERQPKPLVTYVSRQVAGVRRLDQNDHEALLRAFADLEAEGVCEFREARMELITVKEQVELAAKSTCANMQWATSINYGWHPRIVQPFSRFLIQRHIAVWNDRLITYPKGTFHEAVNFSENFQGTNIPVDAATLVKAVRERLAEEAP